VGAPPPQGRGIARDAPFVRESPDEKKRLIHRLPPEFARSILRDFNSGAIDAASAAARLDVSRTRLYVLRTAWLKNQSGYQPAASGGNHGEAWPAEVIEFLTGFLPLQIPPNFQLVADEMERLHEFAATGCCSPSYGTVTVDFSAAISSRMWK
jgi:hypothetical protein